MDRRTQAVMAHYPRHVAETIAEYGRLFPIRSLGVYRGHEWNRLAFACELAKGNSVLDVGVGNGALLAMLWRSGSCQRVCGIDFRRGSKLRLTTPAEFREMNVTDLTFADGEFDTVFCMEVIEHLPPEQVPAALRHLRRVARQRLILTVPDNEPHPLFHQDGLYGHKQSFDDAKLRQLFPNAVATLVPRPRVSWVLIVEEKERRPPSFQILDAKAFSGRFAVDPPMDYEDIWETIGLRIARFMDLLRARIPRQSMLRKVYRKFRTWAGFIPNSE
jgi:ubiquinone/menaquinone biosynthesis C-methylase UbiE